MRVCDATVEVLGETDNDGVMWGDSGLLHLIAERLGWEHQSWKTEERVLNALSKTPGILEKRYVRLHINGGDRLVRCFDLPEKQPCTE